VIGVGKVVSVTVNLTGQVAAVTAAVESGVEAAGAVGTVVSSHVLPRPHDDVEKLVGLFGGAKKAAKKNEPAETDKETE
jgi:microcompartment protein CcmL/EutN